MSIDSNDVSILFVEDERGIRKSYIESLDERFCTVYEASDGEEAYRIYQSKRPSIIVADINMPKLNGLELVHKIREQDYTTRIIMLTAYSDVKYLLEAVGLQLTKYLVKPISRKELADALSMAIDEFSKYEITPKKLLTLKDKFYWDLKTYELFNDGKLIILTKMERTVLIYLLNNVNKICKYDEIMYAVWPDVFDDRLSALKTIVKNLRRKLPEDTIQNVFNEGYKVQV